MAGASQLPCVEGACANTMRLGTLGVGAPRGVASRATLHSIEGDPGRVHPSACGTGGGGGGKGGVQGLVSGPSPNRARPA